MGCDENGNIGSKGKGCRGYRCIRILLAVRFLERACTHAAGPYHYEKTLRLKELLIIPTIRLPERFAGSV